MVTKAQGGGVRLMSGSWTDDAVHSSCDSPSTSRRFALGASNVCLVGEKPTCSVPALLWGCEGLWLYDYRHARTESTPPLGFQKEEYGVRKKQNISCSPTLRDNVFMSDTIIISMAQGLGYFHEDFDFLPSGSFAHFFLLSLLTRRYFSLPHVYFRGK